MFTAQFFEKERGRLPPFGGLHSRNLVQSTAYMLVLTQHRRKLLRTDRSS